MGYIDVQKVSHSLPDGRVLLDEVSCRASEGKVTALVGANGSGKSTLFRLITGDEPTQDGAITRFGRLGIMRQFVGHMTDGTVRDLLLTVAPQELAQAAAEVYAAELALMDTDDQPTQMRYAHAMALWGELGGYDLEVVWDVVSVAALGLPFERAQYRDAATLSGGEQKRLVLETLLRGPDEVLLLDEPDNYLDVPGKIWLEERLRATPKTVLLISHDRELLANTADAVVTIELGAAGNSMWTHPASFATYQEARAERFSRLDELTRRWDEEHAKLKQLVQYYKAKAAYNDGLASRLQAARTRLAKFEEAGPPEAQPLRQAVNMRLRGGRTGKRVLVCTGLGLFTPAGDRLVEPFDLEVWFGDRIAVLGANGSGKSHFLRLLAAGGTDPDSEHAPAGDVVIEPVRSEGSARLGARVRPGWFAQTHAHPEWAGRTLLEILHRGDEHRAGMGREQAARALDRYELAHAGEQRFDTLSGGQQARFQVLLLELAGATMLLLDEPTDNLDTASAEALEEGLSQFTGAVLAVTHDRWFTRQFDRFLLFGADGVVSETPEPIWG
ncbi:MAG: ABC-F family ATP-binding cassette domain-containing protein [Candidatus Nanopelagicales bacterium]